VWEGKAAHLREPGNRKRKGQAQDMPFKATPNDMLLPIKFFFLVSTMKWNPTMVTPLMKSEPSLCNHLQEPHQLSPKPLTQESFKGAFRIQTPTPSFYLGMIRKAMAHVKSRHLEDHVWAIALTE
jgi:hypothetical protein